MTAQPHANVRSRRAIERRALWLAEDAARELPNLPLPDLLQLVHLYAERGSPKDKHAAMRWLEGDIIEPIAGPAVLGSRPPKEVRGDDHEMAAKLRIEERELEAGGLN